MTQVDTISFTGRFEWSQPTGQVALSWRLVVCRKEPSFDSNLTQVTIETKAPAVRLIVPLTILKS